MSLTLEKIREIIDIMYNNHEHEYVNIAYGVFRCSRCPKTYFEMPEADWKELVRDVKPFDH